MYDVLIIGGGASGLACAIEAKRNNEKLKIAIVEALPRVGKKILATGNGRCNLTNLNANPDFYSDSNFTIHAFEKYPPVKIIAFFKSIGLYCVSDDGDRVYPMSNTAASVLDALRFEIERLKVEIITETHVDGIEKEGEIFSLSNGLKAKKIVLSTGGKSAPSQGSDGSGYALLKLLGHSVTKVFPALVQLTVKENLVKQLKGVRVKANVWLINGKKIIDSSKGEVLFTDYGLSGIAIMDISRTASKELGVCVLDLLPNLRSEEIFDFLVEAKKRNPDLSIENTLSGVLHKKLGQVLPKAIAIKPSESLKNISNKQFDLVSKQIKNLKFTVTGTKGFENAQITSGGAALSEFNPLTMESLKVTNLFCTGELLDIDSICGGFNLQWAWASGLLAGEYVSK